MDKDSHMFSKKEGRPAESAGRPHDFQGFVA